ncbi:radical SAM protein [Thermosipho melanesiensis]|uniref:Radical SAM domain protein n=2 Tax=Thermosipho melanesiensis TaxID=46541 RepID=A6LL35_THEM4|nr:radical SAM protein [Thermosipho melanesiensis]ABR30636.1 Radical SAM domain protein [Thermosipho melanesiensis BI429]APT73775.1 radical SAM protein [Thermosipho melanesiensis]OOC35714.1 radical SAM protein [Thermosipho melanesiensis]OOC39013.1 radical SAM protein [Thermosipho melanesiensis]OOC39161.1 radical SAM protein [Thermosipho melanesiensis]
MKSAILIDGYVDEPAVLGVPPYISTYARYIAGTLLLKGFDVSYITIDQIRQKNKWKDFNDYNVLVILSSVTVPGKYIGGTPITVDEIKKIFTLNKKPFRILTGAIVEFAENVEADDMTVDFLEYAFEKVDYQIIRVVSIKGASIVKQHPRYPDVICEVEVSTGCERKTYCTFCSEPILHPFFSSRPVKDIVDEVETLYKEGIKAFRLGRSANILAYGFDKNSSNVNVILINELYNGIRSVAPDLEVLHTDNANPGFIAKYYPESAKAIEMIVRYNTPGDILSFGVESFDEVVRKKNNIQGSVKDIDFAVKLVNEIGGKRIDGVPKLLPGLNFVFGLYGETKRSYEILYKKLREYLEKDMLVRRINLRQIYVVPNTPLWFLSQRKKIKVNKKLFNHYKYLIRNNIDNKMLRKVFPKGTVIRGVIPEYREGNITFARPLGTYPILVGVIGEITKKSDVYVVDYGLRSLTAVEVKKRVGEYSISDLIKIPGIGKSKAKELKEKFSEKLLVEMLEGDVV